MKFGFLGRILRIDLDHLKYSIEEKDENFYRMFMGGRAIGLYYLIEELPKNTHPLSKDNILTFATSVVTGTPFAGNARFSVVAKSPQTFGMGEAEAGGSWGPMLKKCGYDAIVIKGKSANKIWIEITEDKVFFNNADDLWGLDTIETQDKIKSINKDYKKHEIVSIGPAGENEVSYALIAAGKHDIAGRTGMGAVMGSKNLKAIALFGKVNVNIHDRDRLLNVAKYFTKNFKDDPTDKFLWEKGTMGGPVLYGDMGALTTNNFKYGILENQENISADVFQEKGLYKGRKSCWACTVSCRKETSVEEGKFKTKGMVHGPEYETLGSIGSNCGINDSEGVIKANDLCNRLGVDSISVGVSIAWLFESAERNIFEKNVDGIELEFGNAESVCKLIENISYKKGELGNLLSKGVKVAAEETGHDSHIWAVHGKGQEIAAQDPRGYKIGASLGYAVGPTGGDHIQMEHDFQFENSDSKFFKDMQSLGIPRPVDSMVLNKEKTNLFTLNQKIWSLYNCLDICIFVAAPGHTFTFQHITEIVEAVTGWKTSTTELLLVGERALTLARLFNLREGLSSEDDKLPERLLEPIKRGNADGNFIVKDDLEKAIKDYYILMGWDGDYGIPEDVTIDSLGLRNLNV